MLHSLKFSVNQEQHNGQLFFMNEAEAITIQLRIYTVDFGKFKILFSLTERGER